MKTNVEDLTERIRAFADERDWEQFHSPKNLAMALSVEVAELMEHFMWLTGEESRSLGDEKRAEAPGFRVAKNTPGPTSERLGAPCNVAEP